MLGLQERLDALAASPRLQTQVLGEDAANGQRDSLVGMTYGNPERPSVVVAAGVHGDEPAGVEAALRLLEQIAHGADPVRGFSLIVLPCLNPSGLALGTRANAQGQDINRQFHADTTAATTAVRRFLRPESLAVLVDLHTDLATHGFYLFELCRQAPLLAARLLSAVSAIEEPLEPAPFYAGFIGQAGLMAPSAAQIAGFVRAAPGASLAQWAWQNAVPRSYVFETPGVAGMERGVAMHGAALDALFGALEEETKAG